MKRLHSYLLRVHKVKFIIIVSIIGIFINALFSIFCVFLLDINIGENNAAYTIENLTIGNFLFGVFISPFIETAIFQQFLIVFLGKSFSKDLDIQILIFLAALSSFMFGLFHIGLGVLYALIALIMGMYFGYVAIVSVFLRKKPISVLISVYLVHMSMNLVLLLPRLFLSY